MHIIWILLTIVIFLFVARLLSVLGQEPKAEKFLLVSSKTGDVLEMTVIANKKENAFDENEFLQGAQMAFNAVVDAFAQGKAETFRPLVSSDVCKSFEQAIEERQKNEQQMEFALVSFLSCKILKRAQDKAALSVTVEFLTQQINALKDKAGQVLEGDLSFVTEVKDTWVFKQTAKNQNTWIVTATKSEVVHAAV